ncbi:MAG TPA: hypothetical protein VF628_02140 [Allosphingosinicella sp.]|jgi:hypothetical protein
MPKKNQIPFLCEQRLAGGAVKYHWKPSPRLRRAGWQNLDLGIDRKAAIGAALARNDELERWQAGPAAAPRAPAQRPRWRDLVARYKADPRYLDLKLKSRAEYDSRIRTLTAWAQDGDLLLSQIDRPVVIELRDALVGGDGSRHRTAALLRVLSILLKFGADKGLVAEGIGRELDIPTPPKRKRRLTRDQLAPLLHAAAELGHAHVALGITLGFYSMQREGDLLSATGFQIRPVEDVSSDARRTLAGGDGKVSGLWLQQEKTDTWVAVSLAPPARVAVEAAIVAARADARTCTNLILYPGGDRPCPEWRFQRDFRAVVDHAVLRATDCRDHVLARLLGGDPAKPNDAIQFRDLRRSGMCWLRELQVPTALIASISGHSIKETEAILETYMPRDTRAAAEGMAIAVARQAERDAADANSASQG